MDFFFVHFSLPASILPLFLSFQFSSSSSSCHIFNKAFCSLLHEENIRLCPFSASKIDSSDSALPSFFRGMNATYRSELIERRSNGTRVVRVWDPFSGLILRPLSYDFLYKFENPVTDIYPLRLLQENQSVIDFSDIRCLYPRWCDPTQHDPFSKLFHLPPLVKYDIYYSLLSADGLPSKRSDSSSCLEKRQDEDAVAWDLMLFPTTGNSSMGNCYNLSLFAFGYMHGRKLDTQCLSCHILANVNSTFSSPIPADCTCRASCSDGIPRRSTRKWKITGLAMAGGAGFLATLFFIFICRQRCSKNDLEDSKAIVVFLEKYISPTLIRFKYKKLKSITKSFSEKLGQGGYGEVFMGKLTDGQLVAVKVLNESKANIQDFMNEVASIGRMNHMNIVGLIGFCLEGPKLALVYEFMPNGSLEKFLQGNDLSVRYSLGWECLYKIANGIAMGLEYLHKGCTTRVVHFDIKPHNILFDEDFNPKISDFGLSKLCPSKESIISMTIPRGTVGYIAPEVFSRSFGTVSSKADVYSYGMLVLEMVGVRSNQHSRTQSNESSVYFPQWIYEKFDDSGNLNIDIDTTHEHDHELVKKMVIIGLWCIQTNPTQRPHISKVVQMLNGMLEELKMPPKPYIVSTT